MKLLIPNSIKYVLSIVSRKLLYIGFSHFCNLCGSRLRLLLPYGDPLRQKAKCPVCYSLERSRLLWYVIQRQNKMSAASFVLHFAPSQSLGRLVIKLVKNHYRSTDLIPSNYPDVFRVTKNDIASLNYPDKAFDIVICSHVLEHVLEDKKGIQEIYRVLSKTGFAYIMVPIDYDRKTTYEDIDVKTPKQRKIAFGQEDHVRWYGTDFKEKLTDVGFNVTVYKTSDLSREVRQKMGLELKDEVFICTK